MIVALRNLMRPSGRIVTAINIFCLTIGLTVSSLIMLYVLNELSYDCFHKDADRIFRIAVKGKTSGKPFRFAVSPAPLAPALRKKSEKVETATRFFDFSQNVFFRYKDEKFYENNIKYADTYFFKVFTYKWLYGKPETALQKPYSAVITQQTAAKYFGDENPLGKTIYWNNQYEYKITGVVHETPDNSHFSFDILISFSTLQYAYHEQKIDDWQSLSFYSYVKLKPDVDAETYEQSIIGLFEEKIGENLAEHGIELIPTLQAITDIHLKSNLDGEIETNSDIAYIYIMIIIAAFILLIAIINYINLTTACSINRAKEVGIRKVLGAHRTMLIKQFLGEAVLMTIFSLLISLMMIEILLPYFNYLTGKELAISSLLQWRFIVLYIIIALLLTIAASTYPAFYLSKYQPVYVLKNRTKNRSTKSLFRNVLVLIQFSISICLIICTIVIYSQLNYFQSKRLGFDKENIVIVPIRNEALQQKDDLIKNVFGSIREVSALTTSTNIPGSGLNGTGYFPEGYQESEPWLIYHFDVDYNYLKTMGMNLIYGRDFSPNNPGDSMAVIINETLLKELDWNAPIGKTIAMNDKNRSNLKVIGVIEDFHNQSLREQVKPMLLRLKQNNIRYLTLRIHSQDLTETIQKLKHAWQTIETNLPFDYFFLCEKFNSFYKQEQRLSKIFLFFTVLAIFIAALGLFGLTTFVTEQRTKEIGIRKVLGASVSGIVFSLSKEFIKWVLYANLMAWIPAFLFMKTWLENFTFRISIATKIQLLPEYEILLPNLLLWKIFVVSGLFALLVAIITLSFQTVKAATTNPVNTLKYE